MELISCRFLEVLVSDVSTSETLRHFTFAPGDIAVADRGYAQCQGMSAALQQGANLIVRLHPFSVVLGDATGAPLELCAALKRQRMETRRTLVVTLQQANQPLTCGTGLGACLSLERQRTNRARHDLRQGHKKGTPSAESLFLAGWVPWSLPRWHRRCSPAQTIIGLYRCRWQVEIAIKRWKSVLDVRSVAGESTAGP